MGQMLRVLANLPRTLVILLAPPDLTKFDSIPDKTHICDLSLRTQCSCLYAGQVFPLSSISRNKKKLLALQLSYTRALHTLAWRYRRKDFGVEVSPAMQGLPTKESC